MGAQFKAYHTAIVSFMVRQCIVLLCHCVVLSFEATYSKEVTVFVAKLQSFTAMLYFLRGAVAWLLTALVF